MPSERSVELVGFHPAKGGPVRGVAVRVRRADDGGLACAYALEGDLSRIRVPAPRPPRIASGLWRHTCFEAFLAIDGAPAYHELNFSPSGEWALHAFRGYREGDLLADETQAPRIAFRADAGRLELEAVVSLDRLSAAYPRAALRIGLAAVIEADDGTCSYWALRHPAEKPDFHHADGFTLRLEPARPGC